jgi:hypothetical protein
MNNLTMTDLIEQGYIRIGDLSNGIELYAAFAPIEISKDKYIQCHIVDNGISMGMAFNIPLDVVELMYTNKDRLKRVEVKEDG